jgi:1-acyl-sn-glycerol-3-phosphate acyltransferase
MQYSANPHATRGKDVLRPSPEQLAPLTRTERLAFRFADYFNRKLRWLAFFWNRTWMVFVLLMTAARRVEAYDVQRIQHLQRSDRLVMVCNHMSFFDYFVVMHVLFKMTNLSSRILFPVRSDFFYTRYLGIFVNLLMSGMAMFPPIMRDANKRAFNDYAIDRIDAELEVPGTMIGFHPEGTRNKTGDPYQFLPVRPGVGEIIQRAPDGVKVQPIFVVGMSNDILREMVRNLFRARHNPIDIVFGDPVDVAEFRREDDSPATYMAISNECMELVKELAEFQRDNGRLRFPPPQE